MTDPIELAIFKSTFHSIAEEMGAALRRTAFSPNIKERRDYSSAIFDKHGHVIAMGDDMPVHLGSMPMSVRAVLDKLTLGAQRAQAVPPTELGVSQIPAASACPSCASSLEVIDNAG